jgi:hypothetical protein
MALPTALMHLWARTTKCEVLWTEPWTTTGVREGCLSST